MASRKSNTAPRGKATKRDEPGKSILPKNGPRTGKERHHGSAQICIVHLSDVHFGPNHRFDPPATPDGDIPDDPGYPSLLEKLTKDWQSNDLALLRTDV